MQCEVCGRDIEGSEFKRVIDGAKLIVCGKCAKLGVSDWSDVKPSTSMGVPTKLKTRKNVRDKPVIVEDLELIENFGSVIRDSRLRMGLSHESLGKKIGEKVSILKKVEREKIIPDQNLVRKIEQALHIKLLTKVSSTSKVNIPPTRLNELTLGDVVKVKVRSEGDS
ncbi:MAG: multiprotein bridging factor aMBF1 [Candidatus Bathyarchaeia archaeon]